MNWKKLLLAALLVLIARVVLDFIFHTLILGSSYTALMQMGLFRPESEMTSFFWVRIITYLVFCFFFVLIFVKGYENRGLMEGVRYGIYIAIFFTFVGSFNIFVWFGIPYWLTWAWIIIDLVEFIIMGIIAAMVYRPRAGA
jgi:hypothetical protein